MSSGRFLGGLLIGGALGAILGMLLAPRSGEETRLMIRDEMSRRVNDGMEDVRYRTAELKGKAMDKADELREKGREIASDLEEAGRETWDRLRSTTKGAKNASSEEPTA